MKYSSSLALYFILTSFLIPDKYRLYGARTRRVEVLNAHKSHVRYTFLPKRSPALPMSIPYLEIYIYYYNISR